MAGSVQRDERTKRTDAASVTMRKLGREILEERKAQILREKSGNLEKKDVQGRDLLTLLVRANMATDIPDNQRMTDEEVIARAFATPLLQCRQVRLTRHLSQS